MTIYKASAAGEWPTGIHWSAGEVKDVPEGYPEADQKPPKWLKARKRKAAKKTAKSEG